MDSDPRGRRSELMRAGVRARVARLADTAGGRARRWSSPVLLGVLCGGAFAPLLTSGVGAAALAAAGTGAVTAVGGNVLTDVVKAGVRRLSGNEGEPSREEVEAELERGIQEVLQAGGENAEVLRGEIAVVLREVGAVGAALEAAVQSGDRDLLAQLTLGFAEVGREFGEFGFVLADLRAQLVLLRDGMDEQSGQLRLAVDLLYRQATDTRVLLDQVSAIQARTRDEHDGAGRNAGRRWEGCPYRGLAPYGEADHEVFYGRERVTAQLTSMLSQRLSAPGLVVVTGASGAGKSSLLRAGLLPAIGRGELSEAARDWPRHVMEPTGRPLARLATLLAPMAGLDAPTVRASLAAAPDQAHLLIRQAVDTDARRRGLPADQAGSRRLVLVVDQFEQLFTLPNDSDDPNASDDAGGPGRRQRDDFIAALHAAATQPCGPDGEPAALVIAVIRADFLPACAAHTQLAEAVRDGLFLVEAMTAAQLRLTITGPAEKAGLHIDPTLVDAILADLPASPADGGYEVGALPLLSEAMRVTWQHREDNRLTHRGYGQSGGVAHAIQTSAETVYLSLTPDQQTTARHIFHRLTKIAPDGQVVRRPMPYRHQPDTSRPQPPATGHRDDDDAWHTDALRDIEKVIEAFAAQRLIVVGEDTVQITHDALLHAWSRLRGWLEDDPANRALYSQLADAAADWARNNHHPSYLYRGPRLTAVRDAQQHWDADPGRYPPLSQTEHDFLNAAAQAQARSIRQRRTVLALLAGLLAIAVAAASIAIWAQQNASSQRDIAVSRQLAAQSELLTTDPVLSALLAAAAHRVHPTPESRASLINVLAKPDRAVLTGHTDGVRAVVFSPDGRTLATEGLDETVRLWDVATQRQTGVLRTGPVLWAAFSPDGRTLATVNGDSTVHLWDMATRRQVGVLPPTSGRITTVAFSPDGRTLASASTDTTVRLWDVTSRRQIGPALTGHTDVILLVVFSPDGRTLATNSEDDTVRLWDVTTRRQIGRPLTGATNEGYSLTFSPDSRTLATASITTVQLWDVATRRQIGKPLTGHTDVINSVRFSPDGRALASASADTTVRLWDVAAGRQIGAPLTGHTQQVFAAAFSPDGRTVATASADRTARLWNVAARRPLDPPLTDQASAMVLSPDGRTLATISDDRVQLWDVATRRPIGELLTGHTEWGTAATFSPDRSTLATNSDGIVRLWDVATRRQTGPALTGKASAVVFSPDGRTLATHNEDDTVRLWDAATRRPIGELLTGHTDLGTAATFSPDGRTLATHNEDDTVWLWDLASRRQIGVLHAGVTRSVVFSPDGRILATASEDQSVRLWDLATRRQIGPTLTGRTSEPVFSPDGRTLATTGDDNSVRLWDVATRRQTGVPIIGHTYPVTSKAFSPDGRTLVTSSDDTVRLWDVATRRQIGAPLTSRLIKSVVFSPDGRSLITRGNDDTVRLWDVATPPDLIGAVCSIAGRTLTRQEWQQYVPTGVEFRSVCR